MVDEILIEPETEPFELPGEFPENLAGIGIPEHVLEDIPLGILKARTAKLPVAEIVLCPLALIHQYPVGLANLLKPFLGRCIAGISIGMVFEGQFSIG